MTEDEQTWWELSQMTHGEALGVPLALRLGLDAQAADEARHAALMQAYMQTRYGGILAPCAPSLVRVEQALREAPRKESRVGLQVLMEGIFFDVLTRWIWQTSDPLLRQTLTAIRRDEARHHRDGRRYARQVQGTLDQACMGHIWEQLMRVGEESLWYALTPTGR